MNIDLKTINEIFSKIAESIGFYNSIWPGFGQLFLIDKLLIITMYAKTHYENEIKITTDNTKMIQLRQFLHFVNLLIEQEQEIFKTLALQLFKSKIHSSEVSSSLSRSSDYVNTISNILNNSSNNSIDSFNVIDFVKKMMNNISTTPVSATLTTTEVSSPAPITTSPACAASVSSSVSSEETTSVSSSSSPASSQTNVPAGEYPSTPSASSQNIYSTLLTPQNIMSFLNIVSSVTTNMRANGQL
jgi:hypothetical protein